MQRRIARGRRLVGPVMAVLVMLPSAALAQRGMGPRPGGPGGNPVAPIINLRRQLDLTPRQLVQLDSIERALLQQNRTLQAQMRSRMDSAGPRRMDRSLTEEQRTQMREQMREQMRARMDSLRPLRQQIVRNDSLARSRAMAVLTDSQRVRVREWQAERRGFERGRMSARRERGLPRTGFRGAPGQRGRVTPPGPGRRMEPGVREGRPGPRRPPERLAPRRGR